MFVPGDENGQKKILKYKRRNKKDDRINILADDEMYFSYRKTNGI